MEKLQWWKNELGFDMIIYRNIARRVWFRSHGEDQCYVKHPELYKDKREKEADKDITKSDKMEKGKTVEEEKKKE